MAKKVPDKTFQNQQESYYAQVQFLRVFTIDKSRKSCFLLASGEKSSGQNLSKSAGIILRSSTILKIKRTIGPIATSRICPSLPRNLHDFTIHVLCSVFIMKTKSSLLNPQSVAHWKNNSIFKKEKSSESFKEMRSANEVYFRLKNSYLILEVAFWEIQCLQEKINLCFFRCRIL